MSLVKQRHHLLLLRRGPQPADDPLPDAGLGFGLGPSAPRLAHFTHLGRSLSCLLSNKKSPITENDFFGSMKHNGLVYFFGFPTVVRRNVMVWIKSWAAIIKFNWNKRRIFIFWKDFKMQQNAIQCCTNKRDWPELSF